MEAQTIGYDRSDAVLNSSLLVIDCRCKPRLIKLNGDMTFGRLYDGELCDITVESAIVGRRHGEFLQNKSNGAYYYIDNNSLNGTYVNGRRLESESSRGSRAALLKDGDILKVDRRASDMPHPEAVIMVYFENYRYSGRWHLFDTRRLINVTIGSGENNVIRLTDHAVAPSHAILRRTQKGWAIFDNDLGGVKINGIKISGKAHVNNHDVITVGDTMIVIYGNILLYNTASLI